MDVADTTGPEFDWDEANRGHVAEHGVEPEEVEEAILDPDAQMLEIQAESTEDRIQGLGMTQRRRILIFVFTFRGEAIRPVTAYPASKRHQDAYLEGRGR